VSTRRLSGDIMIAGWLPRRVRRKLAKRKGNLA
jgi:hypothetical protein